jgi:hypothetical protein
MGIKKFWLDSVAKGQALQAEKLNAVQYQPLVKTYHSTKAFEKEAGRLATQGWSIKTVTALHTVLHTQQVLVVYTRTD